MVTSCSPKMPKTVEAYQQLAQRDLEIIEAQREEIAKLKGTVNDLRQKIDASNKRNLEMLVMLNDALSEKAISCVYCGAASDLNEIKAQAIEEALHFIEPGMISSLGRKTMEGYAQKLRGEK